MGKNMTMQNFVIFLNFNTRLSSSQSNRESTQVINSKGNCHFLKRDGPGHLQNIQVHSQKRLTQSDRQNVNLVFSGKKGLEGTSAII